MRSPARRRRVPIAVVLTATSLSAVAAVASAAVRGGVPVRPDRDTARGWAVEELAHREYQVAKPGLLRRALQAIWDWLNQHRPGLPQGDGTRIVLVVLIFVLVGLMLYAVQRSGGLRRQSRRRKESVFTGPARTAAGHRAAAEAAERDGQWATAVVERFRAITRELEERAVLVPHPGRTADEVARDAAAWLPSLATQLLAGAVTFDDVRYGDLPASATEAGSLRELDEQVRRTRPAAGPTAVAPGLVAPS